MSEVDAKYFINMIEIKFPMHDIVLSCIQTCCYLYIGSSYNCGSAITVDALHAVITHVQIQTHYV